MANSSRYVILLILFGLTSLAMAEEGPVVTVEDLISRTLEKSSLVREIEARAHKKKSEGIALKTLGNPELSAEVQIPVAYSDKRGSDPLEISLSQRVRPTDFGARKRVNALLADTADQEKAIELLELTQFVRLHFVRAWALQKELEEIRSGHEHAVSLLQLVESGKKQALYSEADYALAKAEEKKLLAQEIGLVADLEKAKAALVRKSGVSVEKLRLASPLHPAIDRSILLEDAIPTLAKARAVVRLSEEQARLARLDRYSSFTPRLVYSRNEEANSYVGAGISFPLPVFDTNQAEIMRTSTELSAARSIHDYLSGPRFKEEMGLLLNSVEASHRQARVYEDEVLPALRRSFDAWRSVFNQGQGSAFQLFQTLGDLVETRTKSLELWIKAQAERSEFCVLIGKDI